MRLPRLVIFTLAMLITAISGVLLAGRVLPYHNSLSEIGFGWCGEEPCFRGLTLAAMEWQDLPVLAKAINHSETFLNGRIDALFFIAYADTFVANSGGPTSFFISNTTADLPVSVGDVMLVYGKPCSSRLQNSQAGRTFQFYYQQVSVTGIPHDQWLRPMQPIRSIGLLGNRQRGC